MNQFSFNQSKEQAPGSLPKSILILGGGTAGWMSATLLAKAWQALGVKVTLLESDSIGTIGVGEGTTPSIKRFFDMLGIDEKEWMQASNATFKTGIRFNNWSDKPEFSTYFHPFFSQLDQYWDQEFRHNIKLKQQGYGVSAHPDTFFPMTTLAKYHKAPKAPETFPFGMHYAYHFDAGLLAKFLKKKAQEWGVIHAIGTVSHVDTDNSGNISQVHAQDGTCYEADLFIDCSGFRSILLGETLEVPYLSFSQRLLNDSAVTIATSTNDNIVPSITQATALSAGWAWKIPLTSRVGNGYVYSSKHLDAKQAESELRAHLGLKEDEGEARHLKMKVGRYQKGWHKNCVALGLSQGFIEPLEATALHFVSQSLIDFVQAFEQGQYSAKYQEGYNQHLAKRYTDIKDYIELHYLSSHRHDTQYWKDCKAMQPSQGLSSILAAWKNTGEVDQALQQQGSQNLYTPLSWYCMLAGVGQFNRTLKSAKHLPNDAMVDIQKITEFNESCSQFFPDHKGALEAQANA